MYCRASATLWMTSSWRILGMGSDLREGKAAWNLPSAPRQDYVAGRTLPISQGGAAPGPVTGARPAGAGGAGPPTRLRRGLRSRGPRRHAASPCGARGLESLTYARGAVGRDLVAHCEVQAHVEERIG